MIDKVAEHIAALKDDDWGVREEAALALGHFRDPRGVRPLIEVLRDEDRAVRTAATAALAEIGEPAVLDVAYCLNDGNLLVQEAAASVLAVIADDRIADPLISALLSEDWVVRMYAAKGLARIRAVQATPTLILLLQDKVKAVRDETILALKAFGVAAVPLLIESLQEKEWRIRLRAAEALGCLGSSLAVEPLLDLLFNDPDTAVRQDVTRALGEIGDSRLVDPLLEVMNDPRLRPYAIEALGKIGDRRALPSLLAVVKELSVEDYEGRIPACADDRYEEQLVPVEAAVKALARIGDPETVPALLSALKSTLIRAEAAEALVKFGRSIIPQLLESLKKEQDENIRYHIQETLARIGWKPGQVRL